MTETTREPFPLDDKGRCANCKDRRPDTCKKCGSRYQQWTEVPADAAHHSAMQTLFSAWDEAERKRRRCSRIFAAYRQRSRRR